MFKFNDQGVFRFAKIDAKSIRHVQKHYSIRLDGRDRVAGRKTETIVFEPNDTYRYGLKVWIDEQTGLLLRSDLLDASKQPIDSYMFINISVDEPIHPTELAPTESGQDYLWNFREAGLPPAPQDMMPISVKTLPHGFRKIKHVRGQFDNVEKEQVVFSDQLATVSLFIEKLMKDQPSRKFTGGSHLGSVNAYGRVISGYQVTVVGEVPAETVQAIGDAVVVTH